MGMKIVYNALIKEIIDKKTKEQKAKQQARLLTIACICVMIDLAVYALNIVPVGIILIMFFSILIISFIINIYLPFGKTPECDDKEVKNLARIRLESNEKKIDQVSKQINEYDEDFEYLKLIANPFP